MANATAVRPIGGTFEDIQEEANENVVEPVKDQIGQAIEVGVQAVVGAKPPTPQQQQQKKVEEQGQLMEARRKIAFWTDIANKQKQVREEEKQKQQMKKQEEEQEKQEKVQKKQMDINVKSQQLHPEIAAKGKGEIKRGVGG
jgi:hypothetical protein